MHELGRLDLACVVGGSVLTITFAILRALVDALLVLESSGPDEIHPDTAVRGMENVASSLLALEDPSSE